MFKPRRMHRLVRNAFALLGVFTISIAAIAQDEEQLPADFTIGTAVAAPAPGRLGTNLQIDSPQHFIPSSQLMNIHTPDIGFEPTVVRHKFIASGGGDDFILGDDESNTSGGDLTFGLTMTDGFFDGANCRVYRISNGEMQLVRTDSVSQYLASPESGFRVNLATTGPPVQEGDLFILSHTVDNVTNTHPNLDGVRTDIWMPLDSSTTTLFRDAHINHDSNAVGLPDNAGATSMRISTTSNAFVGMSASGFGSPENYHTALDPGVTYELNCWLRQEGVTGGEVSFEISEPYNIAHTFSGVSNVWQPFTFMFTGPPLPAPTDPVAFISVLFQGPGTVWVDDFVLARQDLAPFAMRNEALQELSDFQPGTLRLWCGEALEGAGRTLDSIIRSESLAQPVWEYTGVRVPQGPNLPTALPLTQTVGSNPWLVISMSFDEDEWLGLIEYLAAPYDPEIDTPQTKPWAFRRFDAGQAAPWTDVFDFIGIEFGNEPWNGEYDPWTLRGDEYGAFARYFIEHIQNNSPWFAPVSEQIKFILGGFVLEPGIDEFGQTAIQRSPEADYVGVAPYIGGWEAEIMFGGDTITDEGYQQFLLFSPFFWKFFADRAIASRDTLNAQGVDYNLIIYEGGPGYDLPSAENPFNPVSEAYGKSLAAGTATLDSMLYASLRRFGPINYFFFTPGVNYASHTMLFPGDFRPHPTWQAMEMRNRYAAGDIVTSSINSAPHRDVEALVEPDGFVLAPLAPDVPLATVYPFRDGADYSVITLSRKLNGDTPVILRLPFDAASTTTLFTLTGDPRATNVDTLNIDIQEQSVPNPALPNFSFDLPAGSIYLYRFEGVNEIVEPQPTVTINQAYNQEDPTTDAAIGFTVTFSQAITGFDESDVSIGGTANPTTATVEEIEPFAGANYRVTVSGMSQLGTVTATIPAGAAQNSAMELSAASTSTDNEVTLTISADSNQWSLYD